MNEERSDRESGVMADGAAEKRPWHAPDLREVDVFDTEAAGAPYNPADGPVYGS